MRAFVSASIVPSVLLVVDLLVHAVHGVAAPEGIVDKLTCRILGPVVLIESALHIPVLCTALLLVLVYASEIIAV